MGAGFTQGSNFPSLWMSKSFVVPFLPKHHNLLRFKEIGREGRNGHETHLQEGPMHVLPIYGGGGFRVLSIFYGQPPHCLNLS